MPQQIALSHFSQAELHAFFDGLIQYYNSLPTKKEKALFLTHLKDCNAFEGKDSFIHHAALVNNHKALSVLMQGMFEPALGLYFRNCRNDETIMPFYRRHLEEQGSIRYTIDYSFGKKMPSGKNASGETIYVDETERTNFKSTSRPIFFYRSE